jgi:FkbH-like protein
MQSFTILKKNLKKDFSGFKKVKIAILADTASQLMCAAIRAYGYSVQLDFEIYEAEYNQIDLQIFDPSSGLYAFGPDFVILNRSTEKLLKEFYKLPSSGQAGFSARVAQKLEQYYEILASRIKAKVLVNTYPELNDGVFGNFAAKTDSSFIYQQRSANVAVMDVCRKCKNLFVYDLAAITANLGYQNVFDPKMYVNADMVYHIDFLPHIAKAVADVVLSVGGTFKKCLILDLDNTTWGGIIGDDGPEGIQIGYLGLGKVFTDLQLWASALKRRGIILAICSKNTEDIAKEPFLSHPDMVLRMDDIAVFVANWETKVDNIRYIQSVLNIGFDSMVFVDDNPFEREMVRTGLPDVTVPELPADPVDYLPYLKSLNLFETASFTEEDELRTRQYRDEAARNMLLRTFGNEHDFLASLEMQSDVKPFDAFSIPRVAQLTQRSNQFNLRTVRYTEEETAHMAANAEYVTLSLSLEDKFGDHGLIAVVIMRQQDDRTLFVDTWIMSCRVLKRGMEQFTLNAMVAEAKNRGVATIVGEYLPTKKNGIVKDHYAGLGFVQDGDIWVLDVAGYVPAGCFISPKTK